MSTPKPIAAQIRRSMPVLSLPITRAAPVEAAFARSVPTSPNMAADPVAYYILAKS